MDFSRSEFERRVFLARAFSVWDAKVKWQQRSWELLRAVNVLRTTVAHKLDHPKKEKALQEIRKLLIELLPDFEEVTAKEELMEWACMWSIAFLSKLRGWLNEKKAR